jgi:hypothetical protein
MSTEPGHAELSWGTWGSQGTSGVCVPCRWATAYRLATLQPSLSMAPRASLASCLHLGATGSRPFWGKEGSSRLSSDLSWGWHLTLKALLNKCVTPVLGQVDQIHPSPQGAQV